MTILFIILLLAGLTLAAFSFRRSNQKPGRRTSLFLVRILLITAILCAFLQPSFKITSLAPKENIIPVLVDASSSMQLFNADSVLKDFLRYYSTYSVNDNTDLKLVFFGFGDSLRAVQKPEFLEFNDKNTLFPRFINENILKKSKRILILSDGNWTNIIPSKHAIYNKECYFIPLHQARHPAYIHFETQNRQQSVLSDTLAVLTAHISGYIPQNKVIEITCRNRHRIISRKSIPADSGFFNKTIKLPVKNKHAGIKLYELNATLPGDTITNTCYVLHTTTQGTLSAYLYSTHPSLDRRFLTLALKRHENWNIPDKSDLQSRTKKTDIFILFDWDKKAQQLLNKHSGSSIAFIGCLPSDRQKFHATPTFKPVISPDFKYILNNWTRMDFPPPSGFMTCPSAPYTTRKIYMSLDTSTTNNPDAREYPIMFEARYRNRCCLILAVKGLWRWDFQPRSIDKNRDFQFFSDLLLDRMQTIIEYNSNNDFYAYPDVSPIYENDSIVFRLAFPASLQNATESDINFIITTLDGEKVYESSRTSTIFQSHTHLLKAPPLKPGTYQYTGTIATATTRKTYSDSIKVLAANSEVRVLGQNTVVLSEIGKPLAPFDTTVQNPLFSVGITATGKNVETVTRTAQLNRSWFLLILIFALFTAEWVLRRIWRFD